MHFRKTEKIAIHYLNFENFINVFLGPKFLSKLNLTISIAKATERISWSKEKKFILIEVIIIKHYYDRCYH